MMGRQKSDQGRLFYEFHLGDAVPRGRSNLAKSLICGRSSMVERQLPNLIRSVFTTLRETPENIH